MTKNQNKPLIGWLLALFVLNGLYLLYELAFNGRLVDVAVSRLTDSEVHALELEGRFLSGVGLSLLLLRLISVSNTSFFVAAGKVLLAIAIAFPLMFFGQKILVDQLVDSTTPEQRLDAQHLMLLKTGLANDALRLEGIEFSVADLESAHTRTFLSVLGLMTFVSPDFITALKEDSDRIINQVAENEGTKALPAGYEGYIALQATVHDAWQDYQEAANAYWLEVAKLPNSATAAWNEIQAELLSEWEQVRSQQEPANITRAVLALQRNLENYFAAREECARHSLVNECLLKVEEIYTEEVTRQLGRYVAATEWCHTPETVAVTVQRRGRFVTEQQQRQQCRNLSYDHLAERLQALSQQPSNYQAFIRSDEVTQPLRSRLRADGLVMPSNWRADNRDTFIASYIRQNRAGIEAAVAESMEQALGTRLPMDLTAEQFVASDPIQQRLHEALTPLDTNLIITLDMSPITFRDLIIKPHYVANAQVELARLQGEAALFGNGQVREEEGKRYVRGLIVPPIAMGFSLFFSLLNGVGLLASVPALLGLKALWLGTVIKVSGMLAVVVTPMLYHSTVVTTETYRYFQQQAAKALTPAGSLFSTWVINTQPIVYEHTSFTTRLVPPLFPADPAQVAAERAENSASQTGSGAAVSTATRASERPRYQVTQSSRPRAISASRRHQISSIDTRLAVYPQVEQRATGAGAGIMVDVQQLADLQWVLHYDPIISGEGTCLTGVQQPMQLRNVSSLQWRGARHGNCTADSISQPPIPMLDDFTRNFQRLAPRLSLWVHYQPSLLHEVNCHSVRGSAQRLANTLGEDHFVAVVSSTQLLSCFAVEERNYAVAFLGPQYGNRTNVAPASARHLNRADAQRLRARLAGVGYREFSISLGADYLHRISRDLRQGDILLVQPQHVTAELEQFAQGFVGRVGLYTENVARYSELLERYQIIVIRE